jgi:WhiB family transcriptional regulator, redox-sensing transcriptional regulator
VTKGAGLHIRTNPINRVRPEWMSRGVCVTEKIPSEVFYRAYETSYAISLCSRCPVKTECLEFVLVAVPSSQDFGIWGATSERRRRRIRTARAKEAQASQAT